jgi:hypothetical protein
MQNEVEVERFESVVRKMEKLRRYVRLLRKSELSAAAVSKMIAAIERILCSGSMEEIEAAYARCEKLWADVI